MELSLDGKVALVTGASRGIGAAIASALAQAGAAVVITARKMEGLEQAAAAMEGEVVPIAAHAGRPDDAARAVDQTLERFGRLDVLVNNAATNPYMGRMIDAELPAWDKTFEVNLRGLFVWTAEAWRRWMADNGGSVINVASIGGMAPGGLIGVYDLTKAGVIFMTKHLATELGPGVRVNAIAPGLVKTDFATALWKGGEGKEWPWALRRLGEPDDIAPAAVFLASDAAAWTTGAVLVVDGGGVLAGAL
jgi:NAD(P)-dependent dehydrogenase (short-subunit alcohol dehydrogenase family)